MLNSGWFWLVLAGTLGVMVALEFVRARRRQVSDSPGDAWAAVIRWLVTAGAFAVEIYFVYETNWLNLETNLSAPIDARPLQGDEAMLQFLAGLVVELSLSLDNVAVLILLLAYFKVPLQHAARMIFLGTLASLVIRAGLILLFSELLGAWEHTRWLLGGLLAAALMRTLLMPDQSSRFEGYWAVRLVKRVLPVGPPCAEPRLITREGGRWALTPLAMIAVVAGITDAMYALDSVPALFTITRDPFIAFASTAFALLALRSLYLALRSVLGRFRFLKLSLVFILLYLIQKVVMVDYDASHTLRTLLVVLAILAAGIAFSMLRNRPPPKPAEGLAEDARPAPIEDLAEAVYSARRNLRKIAILIAGTVVVLFGALVVGPIPGPGGTFVVAAGLGLLATEFMWARKLLLELKRKTEELAKATDEAAKSLSIWVVLGVLAAYVAVFVGLFWIACRWWPGFLQAFVLATALGASTFVGAWAGKSIFGIVKAWRERRAAKRAQAAPSA